MNCELSNHYSLFTNHFFTRNCESNSLFTNHYFQLSIFNFQLSFFSNRSLGYCLSVWLLDCLSDWRSRITQAITHSSIQAISQWHTILVLISYLLLCFLPLRAKVTSYFVRIYANFPQRSDSVAYLSPAFLSVPSGPGVASFFIISFFDMFPSFFPLWNGKRVENDRITIE